MSKKEKEKDKVKKRDKEKKNNTKDNESEVISENHVKLADLFVPKSNIKTDVVA